MTKATEEIANGKKSAGKWSTASRGFTLGVLLILTVGTIVVLNNLANTPPPMVDYYKSPSVRAMMVNGANRGMPFVVVPSLIFPWLIYLFWKKRILALVAALVCYGSATYAAVSLIRLNLTSTAADAPRFLSAYEEKVCTISMNISLFNALFGILALLLLFAAGVGFGGYLFAGVFGDAAVDGARAASAGARGISANVLGVNAEKLLREKGYDLGRSDSGELLLAIGHRAMRQMPNHDELASIPGYGGGTPWEIAALLGEIAARRDRGPSE
ncbi:hypothetical protein BH09SUM1_BH09SUM1_11910 [soil metagenome]